MTESGKPDRDSRRNIVAAEVRLRRSGGLSYTVKAQDLSEGGCRVEFVERPRLDETVWVKFEGLDPLEAVVRWTRGFSAGLQFNRPIDPRVLEILLRRL